MSLRDFRKLIELEHGALIGVRVEDPNAARPISLDVHAAGAAVGVQLDESEAGELFDAIAQALREVVGGRASGKLHADTPSASSPPSDPSASMRNRG